MLNVVERRMFTGTGTNSAEVTLPSGNGLIVGRSTNYTSPDTGTLVVYPPRPNQDTTANAAVAASATLVLDTDALGKVGGALVTTNDFVLVADSSGTGWQLRGINTVPGVSSSTVSLTLASAITCASGDKIYIVRAADVVTITTAAESKVNLLDLFSGFRQRPVHLILTATGSCILTGSYSIDD